MSRESEEILLPEGFQIVPLPAAQVGLTWFWVVFVEQFLHPAHLTCLPILLSLAHVGQIKVFEGDFALPPGVCRLLLGLLTLLRLAVPGGFRRLRFSSGRLFGLMPHPDAYLYPFHHPRWEKRRFEGALPEEGEGLAIFRNGIDAAASRL